MTDKKQSQNIVNKGPFSSLFNALRREAGDAKILELVDALKAQGHSTDDIVARVVRGVGNGAGVRVQKVANKRGEFMATGTWKRYKMSRRRRFRLWLRDIHDNIDDAMQRLLRAN